MQGTKIVLTPDRGFPVEGIINTGETPKPGQIVQIDPTQSRVGGRPVWKIYSTGTDGALPAGPFIVLTEDRLQGKTYADAYAAGTRAFGFIPLPGAEMNLLYKDVSGTADSHAAGEIGLVDDATGKIIADTGSPATKVCQLQEALAALTADTLAWVVWSGH